MRNGRSRSGVLANRINEHELSAELEEGIQTTRKRRKAGLGPKYTQLGKTFWYERSDVELWLNEQKIDPPRAHAKPARPQVKYRPGVEKPKRARRQHQQSEATAS
jgi:hypothetical protein